MLPESTRNWMEAVVPLGFTPDVRQFPEGTRTAPDAAAAVGCEVAAIVKSLVFMVDDVAVLGLVPGDLRLDTDKLAQACSGGVVRRASLDEVRQSSGFVAGGTPPFGHANPLKVFADPQLFRFGIVWAAAGTPTTVFPISPDELVKLSGATVAQIT